MTTKTIIAGLLGTTLLAGAAIAQTPPATDSTTAPRATSTDTAPAPRASDSGAMAKTASATETGKWRASKFVGLNVYNQNNEKLGDIDELLIDNSGKIQAVVIGVGGFLGVGQHEVAVSFDKLQWVDQPVSSNSAMNKPAATTTTTTSSTTTPTMTTGSSSSSSTADRWYPDHAVFNATKDELKAMPEFTYGK